MLTQAKVNELFRYEDGRLLRRIQRGPGKIGDVVGSVCTDGRLQVKIDGVMYYVHRLIYLMLHGDVPEFVDHKDGDYTNNRIENLRPATRAENNRNARLRKDNKYGVKGVALHKGRWIARLRVDGKAVHVGSYGSMEEAARAVAEARVRLHGEFHKHQ